MYIFSNKLISYTTIIHENVILLTYLMSKAIKEIDFINYLFQKKNNFLRFWVTFVLKNSLKN